MAKSKAQPSTVAGPSKSRYNGFLPIPIAFSTSTSSTSTASSSKSSPSHFLWIKPHTSPSSTATSSSTTSITQDLPPSRTLFIANLPIDILESDLRTVFGEFGVVERVVWKEEEGTRGGGMDDWMDGEDDESESASEDDEDIEEETTEQPEQTGSKRKAHFATSVELPTKRRRNRARTSSSNPTKSSIPSIIPLPSLNPRSRPFMRACSSAYLIYLDGLSLTRAITLGPTRPRKILPRPLPSNSSTEPTANPNPTGLQYYTLLTNLLHPPHPSVQAHADSSLALYDHHLSHLARTNSSGPIVDDDGFTLVVRGGKYGRTAGSGAAGVSIASRRFVLDSRKIKTPLSMGRSLGVEGDSEEGMKMLDAREGGDRGKARKRGGAVELEGFYKFQRNERKRQDLADLRSQFEQDKAKVEALKAKKRFRPY